MGRYSSVQTYADNSASVRSVPYEQATGSAAPRAGGVVKVEKVVNPYGSTAGAGSGEFHVYRHARAREMNRWKELNEEEQAQKLDEEFEQKIQAAQTEEEAKTSKRRKKRERQKEAKMRKKNLKLSGVCTLVEQNHEDDEEFTFEPASVDAQTAVEDRQGNEGTVKPSAESMEASGFPIANDGSFLEQMKKRLREESSVQKGAVDDEESRPKKKRES